MFTPAGREDAQLPVALRHAGVRAYVEEKKTEGRIAMRTHKPGLLMALAAGSVLAGCAANPRPAQTAAPALPPAAVAATAGREENCVQIQNIREARVRDDKTIDFILRDGRTMRNSLPYSCPSLGFEKAFSYATSLSQLCSVDIITVINQGGGGIRTGASCGLGKFVPQPAEAAAR